MVKIYATSRFPEPTRPWTKQSPSESSGTGVVIENKRILTNAHVVLYSSQLFVQGEGSGEKVAATVESIAPGMDMAVLKLDDEAFFERRPPLARAAELPAVKEAVTVYGYPTGGSTQSVTKGIVSRIEFAPFGSGVLGLRIQIDAAINPGNSGGPALVGDAMIGLAFSRLGGADNIGYIIPTEEVELFLKDVSDGNYDGKATMHDRLQTLENDALRAFLKLPKDAKGMVVTEPDRPDADYPLKSWDLITRIGDHAVDNVGMVSVKDGLRLAFQYYIQKESKDGTVPLTIIRDGKEQSISLPVPTAAKHPMLISALQGRYPSYFVYGPLVFSPATSEFLGVLGGNQNAGRVYPALASVGSPLITRRGDEPRFPGEELVVVASPMFPDKIAKGYSNPIIKVVKDVDGVPIKNLRHLVEVLRDGTAPFVTIRFDDRASETIVFNRKEVASATEEILGDNGIRQICSDDLADVWKKKSEAGGGPRARRSGPPSMRRSSWKSTRRASSTSKARCRGKTIALADDPGFGDGRRVEVAVRAVGERDRARRPSAIRPGVADLLVPEVFEELDEIVRERRFR